MWYIELIAYIELVLSISPSLKLALRAQISGMNDYALQGYVVSSIAFWLLAEIHRLQSL